MDAASRPGRRDASSGQPPLARALLAAEDIASAVSVAFGPWGRGVLIQGAAGDLTITRGPLDILEAAFPAGSPDTTPEHVVLLQNARALRQRAGDGVKSFLLTCTALLRELRPLQQRGGAGGARAAADLAAVAARLSTALPRAPDPVAVDAAAVAESLLATRFTPDVAAAALPAVAALLREDAAVLRTHLGVLCRRRRAAGRSVGDSFVRDGVVLDGMLRFVGEQGAAERRRVVVLAGDEGDDAAAVQAAAGALRDAQGALVVTAAVLSDASLLALRLRGAAVLHAVAPEDERLVLEWSLGAGAGAEVEVRAVAQGAAWLGLTGIRQLQLHAPTQQLADQLAAAVRDALQLLTFTRSVAVPGAGACPLAPGGGQLERELHRALGGAPLGRQELLRWHQARHEARARPPVIDLLLPAFDGLDADLRRAVAEAVAAVPRALPAAPGPAAPPEPLALRLAVLQHALSTAATLLSVDRVLSAKRTDGT